MPARVTKHYPIIWGDDWSVDLTIIDKAKDPVDLTGATLRALVKGEVADADAAAILTITITVDADPTTGIVTLSLTEVQTATLTVGAMYVFDLKVETTLGATDHPFGGTMEIQQPVTRAIV